MCGASVNAEDNTHDLTVKDGVVKELRQSEVHNVIHIGSNDNSQTIRKPELEYEKYVLTVIRSGGNLQAVRNELDKLRERLGLTLGQTKNIETDCSIMFGVSINTKQSIDKNTSISSIDIPTKESDNNFNIQTSEKRNNKGKYWFGTMKGICSYDGKKWKEEGSFSDRWIQSIFQDHQGKLWFGRDNGVSCFDGSRWETFLNGDDIKYIVQDKMNNIWAGGINGTFCFDGSCWTKVKETEELIGPLYKDGEGNLWFSSEKGVVCFDGLRWKTIEKKDGFVDGWATSLVKDKRGNIWVATNGGVCRYDGSKWETFTTEDGLIDNLVTTMFEDKAGNFWVATVSGCGKFNGSWWEKFSLRTKDFNNNKEASSHVLSIYQDEKDVIWFSTECGIFCNTYPCKYYGTKDGLTHPWVYAIFQEKRE